ncbi:RNA polymerase sigma factor [Chitinophaga sp. GCM10012297]|uniref:Sigma-70 family RNA polymerase sigma factor n=1 Tax=Chitinophaga chungangae TaxID=2821488 RepID=A0ABS3YEB7_9BACT|nr:sigma-70 family RNA polymerase sigma factor [Chitinophaga chungangae]MBO9153020.1 sigma-70 family RNA polymerase sigma factor [Chitinophaga chungangae]
MLQPEQVPTEEILLAQLREGNIVAKQWLYDRYAAPLYGHLIQLTGAKPIADDLLVITFERIFKNIHEYEQSRGISLFSWLIKMARETAIKTPSDAGLTGNDITHSRSGALHFMNALSEQCKRVFVLCYYKGFSRIETAKQLDMTDEQVLNYLKEALTALRRFSRRS